MTTLEALELAIAALREKCAADRSAIQFIDKPALARHVDGHAVARYQRNMQAITLLGDLKREKEVQP